METVAWGETEESYSVSTGTPKWNKLIGFYGAHNLNYGSETMKVPWCGLSSKQNSSVEVYFITQLQ